MNIKDIARLTNVSVSTVSKVINHKDQSISEETRRRVLEVVKKYNYTPYGEIARKAGKKSFLLGLSLDVSQAHQALGAYIVEKSRQEGYAVILCRSSSPEEEYENISALCSYPIDGILWDRRRDFREESLEAIAKKGIPWWLMDFYSPCSPDNACLDYHKLGYAAAKHLLDYKHTRIMCMVQTRGPRENAFFQGFQEALLKNGLPVENSLLCVLEEHGGEIPARLLFDSTGAICFSQAIAAAIYAFVSRRGQQVPKHFSVVSIKNDQADGFYPELTAIALPWQELASYVCYRLIAEIENRRAVETVFSTRILLEKGKSVDIPLSLRKKRVVLVGSINMDTLIHLKSYPKMGETSVAASVSVMPGGKSLNQAVAISKLGAEAYLIGRVGKDYDGGVVFEYLESQQVSTEGIVRTSKASTGHAYVHIQQDGESGIVIYSGANDFLCPQDISKNISAFQNASFCLLQTEVSSDVVEYAARAAYSEGVKILLKPAATNSISDELIKQVYIFLPNEREINLLCPQEASYEAKADYFLKKGAKHVIITLGHRGCYWSDGTHSRYFEATRVQAVDTTGAADAFAGALVVCLTRNLSMEESIRCATIAAGLSTAKLGACTAMVDQTTLSFYTASGTTLETIGTPPLALAGNLPAHI